MKKSNSGTITGGGRPLNKLFGATPVSKRTDPYAYLVDGNTSKSPRSNEILLSPGDSGSRFFTNEDTMRSKTDYLPSGNAMKHQPKFSQHFDTSLDRQQLSQSIEQKMRLGDDKHISPIKGGTSRLDDSMSSDKGRSQRMAERLGDKIAERRKDLLNLYNQLKSSSPNEKLNYPLKSSYDPTRFPEERRSTEYQPSDTTNRKLDELNQQLLALSEEKKRLIVDLKEASQREMDVRHKCESYEKIIEDLESQLNTLLRTKEEDTANQILQIETEFEHFKIIHDKVYAELLKKRADLEDSDREIKILTDQNAELKRRLQTDNSDQSSGISPSKIEYLEKREVALNSQIQVLSEKLQNQTKSLAVIEKERDSLQNQVSLLIKRAEMLESQNNILKDAQDQLYKVSMELSNNKRDLMTLRKELENANNKQQEAILANQDLQKQLEADKDKQQKEGEVADQKELRELKGEFEQLKHKYEKLWNENQELKNQFEVDKLKYEERIQFLKQSEINLLNEVEKSKTDYHALELDLESVKKQLEAIQQSKPHEVTSQQGPSSKELEELLAAEQKKYSEEIETLKKQLNEARKEIDVLKDQGQYISKRYEDEILKLKKEIIETQSNVTYHETLNTQYKTKAAQLEEQLKQYLGSLDQLTAQTQKENVSLKESLEKLSHENEELKKKVSALESDENTKTTTVKTEGSNPDEGNLTEQLEIERANRIELENENMKLTNKLESLDRRLKQEEAQSEKYQAEIIRLEGLTIDLQDEIAKLSKNKLSGTDEDKQEAGSEEDLRAQIAKLQSEKEDLLEDVKTFKIMLNDKDEHLTAKVDECRKNLEKIRSHESSIEVYKRRIDKMISENENQEEQMTKLKAEKTSLQDKYAKADQEKVALAASYERLDATAQNLSQENKALAEKVKEQAAEIESLKATIAGGEGAKDNLEEIDLDNSAKTRDPESSAKSESALSAHEKKILMNDIEQLKQQLATMTEQYETLKSENEKLNALVKGNAGTEAGENEKKEEGEKSVQQNESLLKDLESKIKELNETIALLEQEKAELAAKNSHQFDQITDLTSQKEHLVNQLLGNNEKHVRELGEMRNNLETLQAQHAQCSQKAEESQAQTSQDIDQQLRQLQEDLSLKDRTLAEYADKIQNLQKEAEDLRKKLLESGQAQSNANIEDNDEHLPIEPEFQELFDEIKKMSLAQLRIYAFEHANKFLLANNELEKAAEEIAQAKAQNQLLQESLQANIIKLEERTISIKRDYEAIIEREKVRYFKLEEYICSNLLDLLKEASKTRKITLFGEKEDEDIRMIIPELKRVFLELLAAQSTSKKSPTQELEAQEEIIRLKSVIDNLQLDIIKYEDELRLYEQEQLKIEEVFKHAKRTRAVLQPIDQSRLVMGLSENPRMKALVETPDFVKHALLYHAFLNEIVFSVPNVQYPESPSHADRMAKVQKEVKVLQTKLQETQTESLNLVTRLDNKIMALLEKGHQVEVYQEMLKEERIKEKGNTIIPAVEKAELKLRALEKLVNQYILLRETYQK